MTLMHMALALDAGDIIAQRATPIDRTRPWRNPRPPWPSWGRTSWQRPCPTWRMAPPPAPPQEESQATLAPMLSRALSPMDFTWPARALHDQVRGLIPWPAAVTELGGVRCKIFATTVLEETTGKAPGTVLQADKKGLKLACGEGRCCASTSSRLTAASGWPLRITSGATPSPSTNEPTQGQKGGDQGMSAREAALQTLVAMDHQKAWSNGHLKKVIQEAHLDRRDAALATRLCFGVLQNRMLLDHYLQQYSTMKLTKMESKVRNSLRLGLYQMLFLTKIPVSAAVSESVALTKKLCKNPRAGGMVNGILRNLGPSTWTTCLRWTGPIPPPTSPYSTATPSGWWRIGGTAWTGEELEALLRWDNSEPPVTVQVNTCRFQTPEVVELLQREGMAVTPPTPGWPTA